MDRIEKFIRILQENVVPTTESKQNSYEKPTASFSQKVFAKVFEETGGVRPDLLVTDYRRLSRTCASVVMTYDPAFGRPSTAEVVDFFHNRLELEPILDTVTYHKDLDCFTLIARKILHRRPYEDLEKGHFRKVTASTYLDVDMGEMWKVVCTKDGKRFLVKVTDDDIEDVLYEFTRKLTNPVRSAANFDKVMASLNVGVGDKVKFFLGDSPASGVVKKVDWIGRQVTIKTEDGDTVVVPMEAIYDVQFGTETKKTISDKVFNYFSKIFPKEYAEQLK